MDKDRRRQLREQYKSRRVTGGIYRIVNRENGRFYLRSTDDIQATRNWYDSCRRFGSCFLPPIQKDWNAFGMGVFALEELDLLEKGGDQTDAEFRGDLQALYELWDEKLPRDNRY